jgi:hypothetical protein
LGSLSGVIDALAVDEAETSPSQHVPTDSSTLQRPQPEEPAPETEHRSPFQLDEMMRPE